MFCGIKRHIVSLSNLKSKNVGRASCDEVFVRFAGYPQRDGAPKRTPRQKCCFRAFKTAPQCVLRFAERKTQRRLSAAAWGIAVRRILFVRGPRSCGCVGPCCVQRFRGDIGRTLPTAFEAGFGTAVFVRSAARFGCSLRRCPPPFEATTDSKDAAATRPGPRLNA